MNRKEWQEKRDICNSKLIVTEQGFLTCTNEKCGLIYKDMVDQSVN